MTLRQELAGTVLTVTLDRPERYNAIDAELAEALVVALRAAPAAGARAVVIRGAGKGFSAGADLSTRADPGWPVFERLQHVGHEVTRAVLACPLPILASVHGVCAGISLALVLGADVSVLAEDARLLMPFLTRGLVPDGAITRQLPRLVGMTKAKELLLLRTELSAIEAERLGLVTRVVPAAQLDEEAAAIAAELATLPTVAVALTKSLLGRAYEGSVDDHLLFERSAQAVNSTTADRAEGATAYRERRPPRFEGH
jgi:2-(1,2-epoxy-1,2-dihydrophenyl)acetyl-CoA isomerase